MRKVDEVSQKNYYLERENFQLKNFINNDGNNDHQNSYKNQNSRNDLNSHNNLNYQYNPRSNNN